MKKKLIIPLLFLIMINIVLSDYFKGYGVNFAQGKAVTKQLVVGSFDIWCRSDGTTWLKYNGQIAKPNSTVKNIKFPVAEQRGYIVKDIQYFKGGKTEFDKIDYKSITEFATFHEEYLMKSIKETDLKLDKSKAIGKKDGIQIYLTQMYINPSGEGEVLPKKSYQGKKVQGIRYYIPMVVTFEVDPALVKRSIDVSFECASEVFEGQDVGFEDLSKVFSEPEGLNELDKEKLTIKGVNGTTYNKVINRTTSEIENKQNPKIYLMEGEYELLLEGWDIAKNHDSHKRYVKVKKAKIKDDGTLEVTAFAKSPPHADYGQVFKVNAEDSIVKLPKNFANTEILRKGLNGTPMTMDGYKIEIHWMIGSFKEGEDFDESKMEDRPEFDNMFEFDYSVTDENIAITYFRAGISVKKQ